MNRRERNDLDKHITGNYGEDSIGNDPLFDVDIGNDYDDERDMLPPEYDDENDEVHAQQANEQYNAYLAENELTEDEHLEILMRWCDGQD